MPLFSVLIAVYNAEPYLRTCLDSLLTQTLTDFEVHCVDDASTDDSLHTLRQYAERDTRFHVYSAACNRGQACARNVALQWANGQYTVMLDADDWLAPDALQSVYETFSADDSIDCAVLRLMMAYPDGTITPYPVRTTKTRLTGEEAFELSLDWRLHGLYALRTSIHKSLPYDETCRLYSDDNSSRLHYLHSRTVALCQGQYFYRQHPESATHAVSIRHFDHLIANQSLKRLLHEFATDHDAQGEISRRFPGYSFCRCSHTPSPAIHWRRVLSLWEGIRWRNLVAHYRYFCQHQAAFNPDDQAQIRRLLCDTHASIEFWRLPWRLCLRPAFFPIAPYNLFARWQNLCMRLHRKH